MLFAVDCEKGVYVVILRLYSNVLHVEMLASEILKCSQNLKNILECTNKLACVLVKSRYNLKYALEAF